MGSGRRAGVEARGGLEIKTNCHIRDKRQELIWEGVKSW